jgi:hypothetical protein
MQLTFLFWKQSQPGMFQMETSQACYDPKGYNM